MKRKFIIFLFLFSILFQNTAFAFSEENTEIEAEEGNQQPETESPSIPVPGNATVIENSTQLPSTREFYTIETPDGNIFYLVIDKQRVQNNVYFLSEVTESELKSLTKQEEKQPEKESKKEQELLDMLLQKQETPKMPETDTEQAKEPEQPPKKKTSISTIVLFLVFILVSFGVIYYMKIIKPKQEKDDLFDDEEDIPEWEEQTETEEEDIDTEQEVNDTEEAAEITDNEEITEEQPAYLDEDTY